MKIFLIWILILAPLAHAETDKEACTKFWTEVRQASDQFESHQDLKAAHKLLNLLAPDKKQIPFACDKQDETTESLNRNRTYRKKLLAAGNPVGFTLAFRYMKIANGAFAEELNEEVAAEITKYPELFLKTLQQERGDIYCPKDLVRAIDFAVPAKHVKIALKARADAFQKVKNDDVSDMKADCIKQLQ